jgi:Family of unknown function (DUF695)
MSPSGIFPTVEWTFSQGLINGERVLARVRSGLPSAADVGLFKNLILVEWVFDPQGNGGLPTNETLDEMERFETAVLNASDEAGWCGTGVAVITWPDRREWRFYAPQVQDFLQQFSNSLAGLPVYPLKIEAFLDESWNGLREFQS